jgi:D-arginine dehydrogenase
MTTAFDFAIIGAGIAGASMAARLADHASVLLIEMEDRPGYHTTGRSAATFEPNYGPPPMLALTRASQDFFLSPPPGFAPGPLLTPRCSLFFEGEGQAASTERLLAVSDGLVEIGEEEARRIFSALRPGYARRTFMDPATGDLDVDLIHQGFLRHFRARGGTLVISSPVTSLKRALGRWTIAAGTETVQATTVVNAAGAWGDVVAALAGAPPVGLQPKRRSIGVVPVEGHEGFTRWPMATDVGETWYAKPQGGRLMVSSADATPVEPHDAYADDLAIAEGIERLMQATDLVITRLEHSWGGLRTFAPDGCPVVGYDPSVEGFFWLVGQGGYGIQSSPALSDTAAAMALGRALPAAVLAAGLDIRTIAPGRR